MAIIKIEGVPLEWPKLLESNRDMGPEDGSETGDKITLKQGQYVVDVMLSDEKYQEMVDAGIPTKGLIGNNYKQRDTGEKYYKAKRGHFNPNFTDQETGERGVVVGPPDIFKFDESTGEVVPWDWAVDGMIGNGTIATVKFNVYNKKIVELVGILVTDLVPFESTANDGGW
jgi:hypothetical protein